MKTKHPAVIGALCVFAASSAVRASENVFRDAGTAAGVFFSVNQSPVTAATSHTGSVFPGRALEFESNPAALAVGRRSRVIEASVAKWFDGLYFNGVYASLPLPSRYSMGLSLKRFALEDYRLDERGYGKELLGYEDFQFGAALAADIGGGYYFGFGAKYLSEKIHDVRGGGVALDWGALARLSEDISAGVSVLNFPGFINYASRRDYLVSNLKISAAADFGAARFFADLNNRFVGIPGTFDCGLALGAEVPVYRGVFLRAGVASGFTDLASAEFSFGFGAAAGRYSVDYAAELLGAGDVHRAGISVKF